MLLSHFSPHPARASSAAADEAAFPDATPRMRLDYLDSLRAIAAIYVVLHHASLKLLQDVALNNPISTKIAQILWFGHFSVNFFIVLSGFCLTLPIARGDGQIRGGLGAFFERRAWRILPPYYASTVLALAVIFIFGQGSGAVIGQATPVTAPIVLTHALVTHDLFLSHAFKINPVLWSIAVEWHIYYAVCDSFPLSTPASIVILSAVRNERSRRIHAFEVQLTFAETSMSWILRLRSFLTALRRTMKRVSRVKRSRTLGIYFVFPLLLVLWRRVGTVKTLIVAVSLSIVASLLVENFWFWNTNLVLHYIGLFAMGMTASVAAFRESSRAFHWVRRVRWRVVTPIATLLFCALTYYYAHHPRTAAQIIDPLTGAWSALILLHAVFNGGGALRRVLDWKPLVFVGSFSYSLYLVHDPVLQLMKHFVTSQFKLAPFDEFLLLAAVGTAVSMIVAYGFFLVAEKPFLGFERRQSLAKL